MSRYACGVTGVQGVGKTTLIGGLSKRGRGRPGPKRSLLPWRLNSFEGLGVYLEEYGRQNDLISADRSDAAYLTDRLGLSDILIYADVLLSLGRMCALDAEGIVKRCNEIWRDWNTPETTIFLHASLADIVGRLEQRSHVAEVDARDDEEFLLASWHAFDGLFDHLSQGRTHEESWREPLGQAVAMLTRIPRLAFLDTTGLDAEDVLDMAVGHVA